MGVDIYGYAEVAPAGRWVFRGQMVSNPEWNYEPNEPEVMPEPLFHSNNKELAAILTDTGNPIRASEPYTPVVPRRGLLQDLSPELEAWLRRHEGEDWFEATWFTAREAVEFGWINRIMRRRAYVVPQVASLFAGCPRGFPLTKWPADVHISYAGGMRDGVEVEWLETYAEIVPEFVCDVLPQLNKLGLTDQVRLVVVASW